MLGQHDMDIFEAERPRLLGLAYRILGSLTDAEDAVQDTFLKWANTQRETLDRPAAWLTTVCTRRCLDLRGAANRARVNYVGAWLPEPVSTPVDIDEAEKADLAASLTTAFLVMLERLTPKERAAYLLHEIFDLPYAEIAETLALQESACRKLVSRAKSNVDKDRVRHRMPTDQQDRFLRAFHTAITDGMTAPLAALLADDIQLSADGGGKVPTIQDVLQGADQVLNFVETGLRTFWRDLTWEFVDINNSRGVILRRNGTVDAIVSFAFDTTGKATDIYVMRNPDKLSGLNQTVVH